MRVLVYGANGWIGKQFLDNTVHECIIATSRADNYDTTLVEISDVKPDAVISFLGRTYGYDAAGTLIPTIDYLELPGKLNENMRDNFYAPFNLARICEGLNIHFIYLGTGCIYTYTPNKKIFTEGDAPNFSGSGYSTVKGYTDRILRMFNNTLQLRIRMPISMNPSPRNFIDKIVSYKHICSIPNSMTVLDDAWAIIDKMIEKKAMGVYNFTNPGTIEHSWVLHKYKEYIDPSHTWNEVSYDEQMKHIKADRSNNELSTKKLEAFCEENGIELPRIQDSVLRCIQSRYLNKVD